MMSSSRILLLFKSYIVILFKLIIQIKTNLSTVTRTKNIHNRDRLLIQFVTTKILSGRTS